MMSFGESVLYWLAFNLYILAWTGSLGGIIFKKTALITCSAWFALTGLLIQSISLAIRWFASGHAPLFGSFENSQAAAWFIVAFTLMVYRRYPSVRFIGVVTYLWVPALLLWGLRFNTARIPLTISERSLWVDLHVLFAWLAFGSFFMAWGLAFLRLFAGKIRLAPSQKVVDLAEEQFRELLFRFITFGFITFTVMLALGSFYEFMLFGQWWQWDVVETSSLITWLLYGLLIHLLLFYRRTDKLVVWLTLLAPAGLLFSYFGLVILKNTISFHNFDLIF